MSNTSASGGALLPLPTPAPLEGQALQVFVQNWIAPISGVSPDLVRPRWQAEPDNIPNAGDAWVSLGIGQDRESDRFPYLSESNDGLSSSLQRQETLRVLCSFYDLGSTGLADQYASLVRDNVAVQQNLEFLYAQSFALAYVGDITSAPTLKATRWLYRVDLPIMIRRQIDRTYSVLSVLSAQGTTYTDGGYAPQPFLVQPPAQAGGLKRLRQLRRDRR